MAVQSESLEFRVDAGSPAAARRFAGRLLHDWDLDPLIEIVELLVSEVVTNVVRHARTEGSIAISRIGRGVRVVVSDRAGGYPEPMSPEPRQPTGRGLAIVDAMATRWGVDRPSEGLGKSVWFEVDALEVEAETSSAP